MTESLPDRLREEATSITDAVVFSKSRPPLLADVKLLQEAADALDVAAYSRGEFDKTVLSFEETIRVLTAERDELIQGVEARGRSIAAAEAESERLLPVVEAAKAWATKMEELDHAFSDDEVRAGTADFEATEDVLEAAVALLEDPVPLAALETK